MAVKFPGHSDNQGTSFLISSKDNGYAVTCYHVVGDHAEVELHFRQGLPPVQAELVPECSNKDMDIAILKLSEAKPPELRELQISWNLGSETCVGKDFRSFGFPKGSNGLSAAGKIESLVPPPSKAPKTLDEGFLQLRTTDVARGMSGAPVILRDTDRVVGMILIGNKTQWNIHADLAFAQTIRAIQSVCGELISSPPIASREEWIKSLGFKLDPFWEIDGGDDPHLLDYFYRVPNFLDILGDISRPEAVLVFGNAGSGKSSLRNAIARMSRNDGALPVVLHDFGPLVNQSQQRRSIQITDHVALMLKVTISAWFEELSQEAVTVLRSEDTKNIRNYLWSYVLEHEIDPVRRGRFKSWLGVDENADSLSLPGDDRDRLVHLCRYIVELCEYKSIYFLVDPDGDISSDVDVAWKVLEPLLSAQRLLELPKEKVAFKFFLNNKFLDQALQVSWIDRIAATRVNSHSLEWSEGKLYALLRERLMRCSDEKPSPYESLGQLSPEVQDLDNIVIRRSQNRPRRLIEICNKLFSVHCQSPISYDQLMITRAEVNEALEQLGAQEPILKIAQQIQQGEGQLLEFKATMRYHTKAKRRDQEMDREVARALCGFMNAQGGTLIIGVDDEGKALGLDADISTLKKKDEDGFELAFTEIVTNYLELPDRRRIKPYFEDYDCKRVYVVEVEASDEPIYCLFDKNTGHEFYIRVGNSTRKLDLKDVVEYIQKHFQTRVSQDNRVDIQTVST
ncbi:MAG: putative DNA binding domain-containing protein [Chloroflexota bacterium]|nr:putative DNA binding domain-containing protein [Chloroflexota bacterium]